MAVIINFILPSILKSIKSQKTIKNELKTQRIRKLCLMKIWINGFEKQVEKDCLLARLISEIEIEGRFAVEINGEIIPRASFQSRIILENDKLEIVTAVGGG